MSVQAVQQTEADGMIERLLALDEKQRAWIWSSRIPRLPGMKS